MRRLAVTVLAATALTVALAAPASASTACTPPKASGFVITKLRVTGMRCATGQARMREAVYYGAPVGYRCNQSPRADVEIIDTVCTSKTHRSRWFSGTYHRR